MADCYFLYRRVYNMEKIICDICGTSYPEKLDNCPVCGCSKDFLLEDTGEDALLDVTLEEEQAEQQAAPRRKNKEIFDFDEVNQEKPVRRQLDEDDFDDDEEYEEEASPNVFLVVILVIVIVLLLLATGFFFFRYFLPAVAEETVPAETTAATQPLETEAPTETAPAGIPCTDIVIPGGKIELGKNGLWLMNVQVYPADTTDTLSYASGDESIATVTADGTVTAVGEGSTSIIVSCGSKQISCNVTVDYSLDAETVPEGEVPGMQVEGSDATAPTEENTDAPQETEATEATETTEATTSGPVELKLKQNDISIFARYTSVQLEMDCDVDPADVYWFTMDSTIAICHDGLITSTGSGMTRIYGEYEGQTVECIVRCVF